MALKILAQNALDGFSDAKTAAPLIELVKTRRPDAAVFPEAYEEGDEVPLTDVCRQLTDADAKRQPTFPVSHPFLQLDHIMLSSGLQATNFQVVSGGGSDHLGIVAEITEV